MRELVGRLCSEACGGRATGTEGGLAARAIVVDALRAQGLDPIERAIPGLTSGAPGRPSAPSAPSPGCGGANVLATVRGDVDRWIVVGAHYDHLGRSGDQVFRGADDNAAAIAVLVRVAGALAAARPAGRGVVIAAFDAEEPPHFHTPSMGSEAYVRAPEVPLDRTDLMVCMDLVGHALGPEGLPRAVRQTLFALGAERTCGMPEIVDGIAGVVPGLSVRRLDAGIVPPFSDYSAFWRRKVPFLFLTAGRWRHYHTPEDTPDKLDYGKMAATAVWLERFVRLACTRLDARPEPRSGPDDRTTLSSLADLTGAMARSSPAAEELAAEAAALLRSCDRSGRVARERRAELQRLFERVESQLA